MRQNRNISIRRLVYKHKHARFDVAVLGKLDVFTAQVTPVAQDIN